MGKTRCCFRVIIFLQSGTRPISGWRSFMEVFWWGQDILWARPSQEVDSKVQSAFLKSSLVLKCFPGFQTSKLTNVFCNSFSYLEQGLATIYCCPLILAENYMAFFTLPYRQHCLIIRCFWHMGNVFIWILSTPARAFLLVDNTSPPPSTQRILGWQNLQI